MSTAVCGLNSTQFTALTNKLQSQLVVVRHASTCTTHAQVSFTHSTPSQPQTCTPIDSLSEVASLQSAQDLFLKYRDFSSDGLFDDLSLSGERSGLDLKESISFFCGDAAGKNGSFLSILTTALFGNDYQQSQYS